MSPYFLCTPFSPFCPSPVTDLSLRVLKCRLYCYSGIVRLKEQETVCYSQIPGEGGPHTMWVHSRKNQGHSGGRGSKAETWEGAFFCGFYGMERQGQQAQDWLV